MKTKLLITVILFTVSLFLFSGEPPKPILEKGDVKNFVKTFPLLRKDLEKFGVKYEAKEGNIDVPTALQASQEFLEILKKHGWDEHFYQKWGVIFLGYSSIEYGKGIKEADAGIKKSLKEIEENEALSKEMKEMLKKQLMTARGAMKTQEQAFTKNIHEADLALIKPLVKELKNILEKK